MIDFQTFKIMWLQFNKIVNYKYEASDDVISIAYEILGNIPVKELKQALLKVASTSEFQINVKDVISAVKTLKGIPLNSSELQAVKAWNTVTSLLNSYGLNYNYLFEDKLITAALDCFGGIEVFYNIDFNEFNKKKFVKYYTSLSEFPEDKVNSYKVLKGRYERTSVLLVPAEYNQKTFRLTQEQAQKLIDNQHLLSDKVRYLVNKDRLLLTNIPEEKTDFAPVDPEKVAEAFEKVLNALSGERKHESN